jgi:hypothetical protein
MEETQDPDDVRVISLSAIRREERMRWVKRTRRSFLKLGVVAGGASGLIALAVTSSWALAAFTFGIGAYVVGRRLGQVVTAEAKVERALYFAVAPLAGIGALSLGQVAWGRWWLAALIGVAGALAGDLLSRRLFRRVAWQVRQESRELESLPG